VIVGEFVGSGEAVTEGGIGVKVFVGCFVISG
jgi:hypothetical protein